MGTEQSQFVEQLGWEGVVGWPAAIFIGIVIGLFAGGMLWREREAIGLGWATAFWFLRLAAFGCILWMLTGPTWLEVRRSFTNQSIAIFADNSESMDVVDPVERTESVRWAAAVSDDGNDNDDDSTLARCDRISVALGAALLSGEELARFSAEHRSPKLMQGLTSSIEGAIRRAIEHASAVAIALEVRDSAAAERATRIVGMLDGTVNDSLSAIQSMLKSAQQQESSALPALIETILENINSARRRAGALGADLAESLTAIPSRTRTEIDQLTRREKQRRSVQGFERELAGQLAKDVHVQRYQFSDLPSPVASAGDWEQVLKHKTDEAESTAKFGDRTTDNDATATQSTNLSAALEQLAQERSQRSTRLALIWSDGRHNALEGAAPHEVAAGLSGLPLYIVPIGNSAPLRDIVLHRVEAPTTVAQNDTAIIDVIVTGFESDGDASDVVLRREGNEIDRKSIEFKGDRSDARIRFSVPTQELGRQEFLIGVEPLSDEVNSANNYLPVAFDVVREHVRVLLADSIARWEFRYLSQLFRRDTHVECDELLFLPRVFGTGKLAQRPHLPRDVDGWAGYDVVILGDLDLEQLPRASQDALDEYVRTRGGNLIIIAGRDAMPGKFAGEKLLDLLPVEFAGQPDPPEGYTLRLTDEGRISSALLIDDSESASRQAWQRVFSQQPIHWISEYNRPKPAARTFLRAIARSQSSGENGPDDRNAPGFLCWQRVGGGRVAFLSAPVTYSLRLLEGDRMHHRFWGQMLRWITAAGAGAGTDSVRLQADRMRYTAGEAVEVTVWLKDKTGQPLAGQAIQIEARTFDDLAITAPMTADEAVPGRYFVSLPDLAAGAYKLAVRGALIDELMAADPNTEMAQATISIRPADNLEMMNTQSNRALLEHLAQMTGGQVIPPTAVGEVLKLLSFSPQITEHTDRTPLWNRWSSILLVLGCLFTEWLVRKAKGLV